MSMQTNMEHSVTALRKNAAELTVMDVYDIAAVLGQEFEKIIDQYGCEALSRLMPKVVRVLEVLEVLVSRNNVNPETEELRCELDRLRLERNERLEKEKKHQKELELVEDVWRGEAQDLLSQITQLQSENKSLVLTLSHKKDSPITEEELQKQEGMSERERQVMKKLKDVVDKQRDEIRAKDHELMLRNEDVEALQMQQHRLMKINQDLRHRIGVVESQGKAVIQQKAELEAMAQATQQELGALRLEVTRLREERRESELARELDGELEEAETAKPSLKKSSVTASTSAQTTSPVTASAFMHNSVWVECGGDPGFLAECFESGDNTPLRQSSTNRKVNENEDPDKTVLPSDVLCEEDPEDDADVETNKPRFTLQELRDVLQEKNELKAQVFMLQDELAYYKSEESDDESAAAAYIPSLDPPPQPLHEELPESGIKRLMFTAVMPMVAAGLLRDDPTLLPIRRLISFI